MQDRNALSVTSRERLRQEIAQQTESFLRNGGHIECLHTIRTVARPIGTVWWETRGVSVALLHS